ncbi:MAG: transketolase-like TK C-terminal-containing protein, partial [Betaproteobacteria bacterium]
QHQDGSSLVMASMVPNCRAWDPAFAGELAIIQRHGMQRMLTEQRDEFHYITLMNENYPMPSLPEGVEGDLLHGMYRFAAHTAGPGKAGAAPTIRLLGSGTILLEVIAAGDMLTRDWGISTEIFSVTSFAELAREAREIERSRRLGLDDSSSGKTTQSTLERLLPGPAPIVAATDHVRAWPQLIAEYVDARMVTLGTDGFGRSDTRQHLRQFFEVDRQQIVLAALEALARGGNIDHATLAAAQQRYAADAASVAPWDR